MHRHEVFDGHALQEQPKGGVRPDASKNGQISPLGRRSGCQDYGRRPRRQAVLSKRGNSAKIHPGLGFIWEIPDYMCSCTAPFAGRPNSKPLFLRCTCSVSAKIS